jgi:hypothetical protein
MRLPTELRELFFQLSVEILSITNPLRIEFPAGFYEVFNFPPRQGRPYQALFQKGDGAH